MLAVQTDAQANIATSTAFVSVLCPLCKLCHFVIVHVHMYNKLDDLSKRLMLTVSPHRFEVQMMTTGRIEE